MLVNNMDRDEITEDTPEEIRFGARFTVSALEYFAEPERAIAMAEESLQREMAYFLRRMRSKMIVDDDRKEFFEMRLEVYAATPEKFWEIVNKEAMKIAERFQVVQHIQGGS